MESRKSKSCTDPKEQKHSLHGSLHACHSMHPMLTSGHFGIAKTCKMLTERFIVEREYAYMLWLKHAYLTVIAIDIKNAWVHILAIASSCTLYMLANVLQGVIALILQTITPALERGLDTRVTGQTLFRAGALSFAIK